MSRTLGRHLLTVEQLSAADGREIFEALSADDRAQVLSDLEASTTHLERRLYFILLELRIPDPDVPQPMDLDHTRATESDRLYVQLTQHHLVQEALDHMRRHPDIESVLATAESRANNPAEALPPRGEEPELQPRAFPEALFRYLNTRPVAIAELQARPEDFPGRDQCVICQEPYSNEDRPLLLHDDRTHALGERCLRIWISEQVLKRNGGGLEASTAFKCVICRQSLETPEMRDIVDFMRDVNRANRG